MKTLIVILAMLAATGWGETNLWLKINTGEHAYTNRVIYKLNIKHACEEIKRQGNMEKLIRHLAATGEICAVFGHQWTHKLGDIAYANTRMCRICGKCESKPAED